MDFTSLSTAGGWGALVALLAIDSPVNRSVAKVLDAISDFIPNRSAKARDDASAALIEAESQRELSLFTLETSSLEQRAAFRIANQERRRQRNIEAIAANACKFSVDGNNDLPSPDFVAEFFNTCQDVSDDKLQILWGKLLAEEVASPGRFSRRTIATIKLLDASDAHAFSHVCLMIWQTDSGLQVIAPGSALSNENWMMPCVQLCYDDLVRLEMCGLIRIEPDEFAIPFKPDEVKIWSYFGQDHAIMTNESQKRMFCGHVVITPVGRELSRIASVERAEAYREKVVTRLLAQGFIIDEGI